MDNMPLTMLGLRRLLLPSEVWPPAGALAYPRPPDSRRRFGEGFLPLREERGCGGEGTRTVFGGLRRDERRCAEEDEEGRFLSRRSELSAELPRRRRLEEEERGEGALLSEPSCRRLFALFRSWYVPSSKAGTGAPCNPPMASLNSYPATVSEYWYRNSASLAS